MKLFFEDFSWFSWSFLNRYRLMKLRRIMLLLLLMLFIISKSEWSEKVYIRFSVFWSFSVDVRYCSRDRGNWLNQRWILWWSDLICYRWVVLFLALDVVLLLPLLYYRNQIEDCGWKSGFYEAVFLNCVLKNFAVCNWRRCKTLLFWIISQSIVILRPSVNVSVILLHVENLVW